MGYCRRDVRDLIKQTYLEQRPSNPSMPLEAIASAFASLNST